MLIGHQESAQSERKSPPRFAEEPYFENSFSTKLNGYKANAL
ncbi:hypothetical protein [Lysinibacillus sp. fls2-241-R2A-57]|nr:hypothetical protein [Lysinibacillus sp. fls2-241-R2A-57]